MAESTPSTINAATRGPSRTMLVLAFATVYVVWGSTYLAIKIALESFPPFVMAGLRFTLGGALLFAIMMRGAQPWPSRRQWLNATVVGTLLLLGGNGLVCWAEQYVASGVAALVIATAPLWFALLDWTLFRGPRPTLVLCIGIALGLLGVATLLEPSHFQDRPVHVRGAVALLIACMLWAGGSLYSKRIDLPKSPFVATAMEMVGGGVMLLLVATVMSEWGRFDPARITLRAGVAFAYLFLIGSMVALTAYVWLLNNCAPSLVSTYAFVNPVIAVLLGTLFGEALTGRTLLSMTIIVVGVMVITLAPRPRKDAPAARRDSRRGVGGAEKNLVRE